MTDKSFWLCTIDGVPCEEFPDRKKGVKYVKELLAQSLKDLEQQDETDEYTYNITLGKIELKRYMARPPYLGLGR